MNENTTLQPAHDPLSIQAEAVTIACIDPRFTRTFSQLIKENFGFEHFFSLRYGGGAGKLASLNQGYNSRTLLEDIGLGLGVTTNIIAVTHGNKCAAYANAGFGPFGTPEEEEKFHEMELKKASEVLQTHFNFARVQLAYLRIDNAKPTLKKIKF